MTNELTVSLFKLNIIQMKMLTSSGCRCLYSNLEEQQQHQVPTLTRAVVVCSSLRVVSPSPLTMGLGLSTTGIHSVLSKTHPINSRIMVSR